MDPIVWMDGTLVLFGAAALLLAIVARWRSPASGSLGLRRAVAVLAFVAGLASFVAVAADVGLGRWEKIHNRLPFNSPEDYAASSPKTLNWSELPTGAPAPDFTLPRLDGGPPIRLSALRGHKPVLLVLSSFG